MINIGEATRFTFAMEMIIMNVGGVMEDGIPLHTSAAQLAIFRVNARPAKLDRVANPVTVVGRRAGDRRNWWITGGGPTRCGARIVNRPTVTNAR